MAAVIETHHLCKNYGRGRGIKDINLRVEAGEVFGFLGPNGAGKTTMIRTLLDFLHPSSGEAKLFGLDSRKDSVAIRRHIGNLPGEFGVDDALTGERLLKFYARLRGVTDLRYAYELAERLGAELNKPLRRLSRGNKQKIGLVHAMFHQPPLLILDEPSGGLDPLVQEEFLRIIAETSHAGRTVFFSSHILSEVERVCDRVGIIRDGELIKVETTDSLLGKQFRHVRLSFEEVVDSAAFAALPGVQDLRSEDHTLNFTLLGGLDALIKLTAQHNLLDMQLERPSLEEIFLTYYDQHHHEA